MRRLARWLPAGAWALLIFWLSATPNLRFEPDALLDFIVRKLGHMAVFGILALLVWWALASTTHVRRPAAWAGAIALLYAVSDELHQGFTAGRHPAVSDVFVDGLGIAGALVLGQMLLLWRRERTAGANPRVG